MLLTITDNRAEYQKRLDEYTSESREFFPTGWAGDFRKFATRYKCIDADVDREMLTNLFTDFLQESLHLN